MEKSKYIPPKTSDGKEQFVPVVIKSKDYLVGVIRGVARCATNDGSFFDGDIDSSRFNDVFSDGVRLSNYPKAEIKRIIKDHIDEVISSSMDENSENGEDILKVEYFSLCCDCGNYVSFKNEMEIPENDFRCDICDRYLIQYTGKYDHEFDYDGNYKLIQEVYAEIDKELKEDSDEE